MGAIYQEANQVVIWLGGTQDMTEEDITSLCAPGTDSMYRITSSPCQRAFYQLLLKPYWKHVWIIQELASVFNIIAFCGPHKTPFQILEQLSRFSPPASVEEVRNEEPKARIQNLLQFRNDRLRRKPVRLLDAIYRSRYALSTDPKDKIYGLLGLVYDGGVFIPEPNYRQSIGDTYAGLSKALLQEGFPLDLIYLRTSHRQISASLPSWVVDWNDLKDTLVKEELEYIQAVGRTSPW